MTMEIQSRTWSEGTTNSLEFSQEKCDVIQAQELEDYNTALKAYEASIAENPDDPTLIAPQKTVHIHNHLCYERISDIVTKTAYYGTVNGIVVTDEYESPEKVPTPSDADIAKRMPPDLNGFYVAMTASVGIERGNDLINQNPLVMRVLDAGNYPLARQAISAVLAAGKITQTEHDTLLSLMDQYHLN